MTRPTSLIFDYNEECLQRYPLISKKTTRETSPYKARQQFRIYQGCIRNLKNSLKARKQQENLSIQLIKNVSHNWRILSKQENKRNPNLKQEDNKRNQRNLFIQSKKTTRINSSFKARKLLQNAALHTSVGSENEQATYIDIVSSEYSPSCTICIWMWMNWTRSD